MGIHNVVLIGFDGTIETQGEPRPDVTEILRLLNFRGYRPVVITSRNNLVAVQNWLQNQGLASIVSGVTNRMIPHDLYIDENALRYDGDWSGLSQSIKEILQKKDREIIIDPSHYPSGRNRDETPSVDRQPTEGDVTSR